MPPRKNKVPVAAASVAAASIPTASDPAASVPAATGPPAAQAEGEDEKTISRTFSELPNDVIDRELSERGLSRVKMRNEGNCGFEAFALRKFGSKDQHTTVRSTLAKFVRENPAVVLQTIVDGYAGDNTGPRRLCTTVEAYAAYIEVGGHWMDLVDAEILVRFVYPDIGYAAFTVADDHGSLDPLDVYVGDFTQGEGISLLTSGFRHFDLLVPGSESSSASDGDSSSSGESSSESDGDAISEQTATSKRKKSGSDRRKTGASAAKKTKAQAADDKEKQKTKKLDLSGISYASSPRWRAKDTRLKAADFKLTVNGAARKADVWSNFCSFVPLSGGNLHGSFVACICCHARALKDDTVKWIVPCKNGSTRSMIQHQDTWHREAKDESAQTTADAFMRDPNNTIVKFLDRSAVQASHEGKVAKFVVENHLPFAIVESASYREMIGDANARLQPISVVLLKKRLATISTRCKAVLKEKLKGKQVSITLDHWTSISGCSYLAVTVHFIDGYKLVNFPLCCKDVHGSADAQSILCDLEEVLVDWELPIAGNLVSVTSDSAPNMTSFGSLIIAKYPTVEFGYCADHILNLTTKLAFDLGGDSPNLMKKCRALVQSFTGSSQLNDVLLQLQKDDADRVGEPVTVIADVATRWWSTYAMIERLLRLMKYFAVLETKHNFDGNLTLAEWGKVEQVLKILAPFKTAQKLLEGEKYVTISLYPLVIKGIRAELKAASANENADEDVRRLSATLLADFNQRWGSGMENTEWGVRSGQRNRLEGIRNVGFVAALLDPRTKALGNLGAEDKAKVENYVRERMIALTPQSANAPIAAPPAAAIPAEIQAMLNLLGTPQNAPAIADAARGVAEELEAYKREPALPLVDSNFKYNDPLPWWKLKKTQYPRLHDLAMQILPIQATSASSERVFSTAGLTIANDRARLLPENAAILIFLRAAWPVAENFAKEKITGDN